MPKSMPRQDVLSPGTRRAETMPVRFADDEPTRPQLAPTTKSTSSVRFYSHYLPRRPTNETRHGSNIIKDNSQGPSADDPYASPVEWQEFSLDRSGQQPCYVSKSRSVLVPIDGPRQTNRRISFNNVERRRMYERSQRHSIDSGSESNNESRRSHFRRLRTYHHRPLHSPDQESSNERSDSDVSSDADVSHAYSFEFSRHDKNSSNQDSTLWSLPVHSEKEVSLPGPKEPLGSSVRSQVHQVFRSEYIGEGSIGGIQAARVTIMRDGISGAHKPLPLFRWM